MREIRMLRATWRGLETWHGRDASANWRASPRPYREAVGVRVTRRADRCRGAGRAVAADHVKGSTEVLACRSI